MKSLDYKVVNKRGICLRPPVHKKGENILKKINPIIEHERLELVRIGILATPRFDAPKIETYEGVVKVKEALSSQNPQALYCICLEPSVMKKISKRKPRYVWTTINDLIIGYEKAIRDHPELRFYIYYLLLLDKGARPNFARVMCEFTKIFPAAPDSEVGMMYAPEKKTLDLKAIYRNPEWIKIEKGGYWVKHKRDLIPNIYVNLPIEGVEYVEALYAKGHAHNLTHLREVFMVRGCDLKERIKRKKEYEALENGKCYEVDIDSI